MKKKIVGLYVCMLLIIAVIIPTAGTTNETVTRTNKIFEKQTTLKWSPGEFIVKLKENTDFSQPILTTLNVKHHVNTIEKIFNNAQGTPLENIYLLHIPIDSDILTVIQEYNSCPNVLYAEPNGIAVPCGIPNDANFSSQWHLHNTGQVILINWTGKNYSGIPDADIDAPEAWDIETGNPEVVIAIIDSGIDDTHPDLAANIWNNTDEIPGNGIDDDANGYIDDTRGWDFCYNDNDPKDEFGHGTLIAGVAGAVSDNGIWGAGVAWNCKIMPIRGLNETGWGLYTNLSKAIRYAADNNADVISISWGGSASYVIENAINYAYSKGIFLCAAAGNSNSWAKFFPAAYDNITAVAMTNQNDSRCSPLDWNTSGWGSNYGDWVDIAAPGNIIYSTMPTYHVLFNDYGFYQNFDWSCGTSYSSPIVAGTAALLLSKDPTLTPDEVKALLCGNVDPYNSTEYIGTGRLNVQKALIALQLKDQVAIKSGFGVKLEIINPTSIDFTNISWQIHVQGGMIGMINKTVKETIDIPAGNTVTVTTGLLLGFGPISIIANVASIEHTTTGMQLIIFSLVKK